MFVETKSPVLGLDFQWDCGVGKRPCWFFRCPCVFFLRRYSWLGPLYPIKPEHLNVWQVWNQWRPIGSIICGFHIDRALIVISIETCLWTTMSSGCYCAACIGSVYPFKYTHTASMSQSVVLVQPTQCFHSRLVFISYSLLYLTSQWYFYAFADYSRILSMYTIAGECNNDDVFIRFFYKLRSRSELQCDNRPMTPMSLKYECSFTKGHDAQLTWCERETNERAYEYVTTKQCIITKCVELIDYNSISD